MDTRKRILLSSLALGALAAFRAAPPAVAKEGEVGVELVKLGSYASGVFSGGGAEIAAFDAKSARLFVVNGDPLGPRIDVLDLKDPEDPQLLSSIDVTEYGGSANSVAVHDGVVAVAIQAKTKTDPGSVAFFDEKSKFLAQVTVGAVPDMLTFTKDGRRVLVCNEGEPADDYSVDPEGSVSIIELKGEDGSKTKQSDVTTVGFAAFEGAALDPSVRVYGQGNPGVARDFEPEYLTVSHDGLTAWVTLQENNAVAILDLETKQFTSIVGLGFKDHSKIGTEVDTYAFPLLDPIGTTIGGTEIRLGGFSGLMYEGEDAATGRLRFLTHTDRGPNAEPVDTTGDGINDRPFALPGFQPRWVRFELDPGTGEIAVTQEIGLTRKDGTAMTGVSNALGANGKAHSDENPVGADGQVLTLDPLGADLEGIVRAPDGTYWMCDEYRPSFLHFDADGKLIERYVPAGSPAGTGVQALPGILAQRRANRGFEGVAMQGTRLYGFVQSPVDNPDVANDANSRASRVLRIVEFDTVSFTTTAQYAYIHEPGSDKIGDAVSCGPGEFLVVERDDLTGAAANKKIWRVSINGATKLSAAQSDALELTPPATLPSGVRSAHKSLYVDLARAGYAAVDKVEGITLLDAHTIGLLNDNDFAMNGTIDPSNGTVGLRASSPILLGILRIATQGLDASDREISSSQGAINIRPWPVLGMYEPDSIAAARVKGKDWLFLANEGDTRVWGAFSEEVRVKDIPLTSLDPVAFPNAAMLRQDGLLGRLTVTSKQGDLDGDGDFDVLYVPGGRSFSVRDASGDLVWDSGEAFERITAELFPNDFNSTNDANASLDNRSDNKGPEPEGLCLGEAFHRLWAFIGLERLGGVMVYDVSDPESPEFAAYATARDFSGNPAAGTAGDLGPEGVLFVEAKDSPNGKPLVVVANEISGTTTVFELRKTDVAPKAKKKGKKSKK